MLAVYYGVIPNKTSIRNHWNDDGEVGWRIYPVGHGPLAMKFGRRCDAEKAMKRLNELPIDWDLPLDQLRQAVYEFGIDRLREEACSVLAW